MTTKTLTRLSLSLCVIVLLSISSIMFAQDATSSENTSKSTKTTSTTTTLSGRIDKMSESSTTTTNGSGEKTEDAQQPVSLKELQEKQKQLESKMNQLKFPKGVFVEGYGNADFNQINLVKYDDSGVQFGPAEPYVLTAPFITVDLKISAVPFDNVMASGTFRLRNNINQFFDEFTEQNYFTAREIFIEFAVEDTILTRIGDFWDKASPLTLWMSAPFNPYEGSIFSLAQKDELYDSKVSEDGFWALQGIRSEIGLVAKDIFDYLRFKLLLSVNPSATAPIGGAPTVPLDRIFGLAEISMGNLMDMVDLNLRYIRNAKLIVLNNENLDSNDIIEGEFRFKAQGLLNMDVIDKLEVVVDVASSTYDDNFTGDAIAARSGIAFFAGLSFSGLGFDVNVGYRSVDRNYISQRAQNVPYAYVGLNDPQIFPFQNNPFAGTPVKQPNISDPFFMYRRYVAVNTGTIDTAVYLSNIGRLTEPVGLATRNRSGISGDLKYTLNLNDATIGSIMATGALLSEIEPFVTGEGILDFLSFSVGLSLSAKSFLLDVPMLSDVVLSGYLAADSLSSRAGTVGKNSMMASTTLDIILFKKFGLLFGYKIWNINGSDYVYTWSNLTNITGFVSANQTNIQDALALGAKYNVTSSSVIMFRYVHAVNRNRVNVGDLSKDYHIDEFTIFAQTYF